MDPCCCDLPEQCATLLDEFERTPSTNLGPNWNEISGDWEIVEVEVDGEDEGMLQENGTANAIAIITVPAETIEQTVKVNIHGMNVGDKLRIICNYVDETKYFMAEAERTGADTWTARLYQVGSLLLTYPDLTWAVAETDQFDVCFTKQSFTFSKQSEEGYTEYVWVCDPNFYEDGFYGGVGNGGSTVLQINTVYFATYRSEEENECCAVQCHCNHPAGPPHRVCLPFELTATFTAFGGCEGLDGTTLTLTWDPAVNRWTNESSELWAFGCHATDCDQTYPPGSEFKMTNIGIAPACEEDGLECDFYAEGSVSVECDPFEVVMDAVSYQADQTPEPDCSFCDPLIDGGYFITVTL